jgi:uncharacterized circularly permuted ATP-grasp superfamily protein/uncharacterized alpha-E superfamily protein
MSRELLADYTLSATRYDEMLEAPHTPRAHWRPMFEQLVAASAQLMKARLQSVQRQVRENGVTYNVYADPQGADRPWELDLLPLILPPEEWQRISAAVAQRAKLLDLILRDVYGEQLLLREGLLPPTLVYGHAGYLRPCRGAKLPGGFHLHLYAADLARAPDGNWWVMADRTQAPSGAGYALENRLVISRLFSELFHDLKVEHLARFFATLRDSLAQWAPEGDGSALTVLLTPGPYNETYFEHAYLARYLGFPLVEGSDLTVRESKVWLKTLAGLRRVNAILRRLDGEFCDPLELRADSALGVPGLVEAIRRGNVLVANALGSSLLESGMLLGFLPRLAKRLLGEALAMPSVATWWCGEPAALENAIARLDHLVIKPAFPQLRVEPEFGEDLSEEARGTLVARMRARPRDYVAQELVHLSQAPVWERDNGGELVPRATGLRVYACASPDGYVVMPGGLTRVAAGADVRVVSMQRGGASKDTWVLSSGPVSTFSLLRRATRPQDLVRTGVNFSSRVVENLFWFGRHAERSEDIARLLRVALGRMIDESASERERAWPGISGLLARVEVAAPGADDVALVRALRAAIADDSKPGLAANLRQLARSASHLRELMSTDNWRALNQMMRSVARRKGQPLALSDALSQLDGVIASLMTLAGFTLDGMTRDQGWRFLSMGRRIERLQWMCVALTQALLAPPDSELGWLLELADSTLTYRARYMGPPDWLPVLDLLVCDRTNPRSVAFQLYGLRDYVDRIAAAVDYPGQERLAEALAALEALDPGEDLRYGSERLLQRLDDWYGAAYRLSEQLALHFFVHAGEINRQTFAT